MSGTQLTRRELLASAGALVVYGSGMVCATGAAAQADAVVPVGPPPSALDTWIRIGTDGHVIVNSGKMDCGQGLGLAYAQIVAEELDVPVDAVTVNFGDTRLAPNQGGGSASSGMRMGAKPLRNASAEARRVLVGLAAQRLGQPPEALEVIDGRVLVKANPSMGVSYADLIGGKDFATSLKWNNEVGNAMDVKGLAQPKPVSQYRVVGKGHDRKDIADKVGIGNKEHFTAHVRPAGLLHARAVRPPVASAMPVSVDAKSIAGIRGARHYVNGGFVAVVADREWDAVRAARALKVTWSDAPAPFVGGEAGVFDYIRAAKPTASNAVAMMNGKKDYDPAPTRAALAASARVIEAEYECAFQSHARMGPSCGVADVQGDQARIWSDTQKPHYQRDGIAKLLKLPPENVQVTWMPGAGSYGRSDADEAPYEAALLSQHFKRPVRVQWSRQEGTAWDPKAPAGVIRLQAGLDAGNQITGWLFQAKGFNGWDVKFNAEAPEHTLVGMLIGYPKWKSFNYQVPEESYKFANHVHWWETVPPYLEQASPLRTAHMRAPQEMQTRFGQESFVDEVAHATGTDPLEFRLKHVQDPREAAVMKAATEKLGWKPAGGKKSHAKVLRGQGLSLYTGYGSHAALACEVEVNRETGRIWVRRLAIGYDCGLVVNPTGVRAAIEGQTMQGISRALYEEVHFDDKQVTSVDWQSYRIANLEDMPEQLDIVLLDRPDKPIGGAGEPALVGFPAAIANAVFDATGVRIRRYPMTPARVQAMLA